MVGWTAKYGFNSNVKKGSCTFLFSEYNSTYGQRIAVNRPGGTGNPDRSNIMSLITYTDVGKAIILAPRLTTLSDDRWGTNGSVGLAILLGQNNEPQCYALVWQWGGDWTSFGDGDEADLEKLNGWEPDAIREAVAAATEMLPDNEQLAEDLGWFTDWADAAEETLAGNDA